MQLRSRAALQSCSPAVVQPRSRAALHRIDLQGLLFGFVVSDDVFVDCFRWLWPDQPSGTFGDLECFHIVWSALPYCDIQAEANAFL